MGFIDQLVDQLKTRIGHADETMGELAGEVEKGGRRREAYGQLEGLFEDATEDGYLDAGEVKNLIEQFRAQGLDTKALEKIAAELRGRDSTGKVEATASLRDKIAEQLSEAKSETRDPTLDFKIQLVTASYKADVETVAMVRKAEHDAYMEVIRKIGAA